MKSLTIFATVFLTGIMALATGTGDTGTASIIIKKEGKTRTSTAKKPLSTADLANAEASCFRAENMGNLKEVLNSMASVYNKKNADGIASDSVQIGTVKKTEQGIQLTLKYATWNLESLKIENFSFKLDIPACPQ